LTPLSSKTHAIMVQRLQPKKCGLMGQCWLRCMSFVQSTPSCRQSQQVANLLPVAATPLQTTMSINHPNFANSASTGNTGCQMQMELVGLGC
jgi:hypothetical protein